MKASRRTRDKQLLFLGIFLSFEVQVSYDMLIVVFEGLDKQLPVNWIRLVAFALAVL